MPRGSDPTEISIEYERRKYIKLLTGASIAGVTGLAGCSGGDGGGDGDGDGDGSDGDGGGGDGSGDGGSDGGGEVTVDGKNIVSSAGGTSVDIWVWVWGPHAKMNQSRARTYVQHPDVGEVTYTVFPFSEIPGKLSNAIGSGNPPTTSAITGRQVNNFGNEGALVNLNEYEGWDIPLDSFLESIHANMAFEGGWYSVPSTTISRVLNINVDMFKDAGLEVPDHTYVPTHEDVRKWGEALTTDDHVALTHNAGRAYYNWALSNGAGFVDDYLDPTDTEFDSEEAINTLRLLVDLNDQGYMNLISSVAYPRAVTDFTNENCAMITAPTASAASVYEAGMNFRVLPLPVGPGGGDMSVSFNGGMYFCVPQNSPNKELGVEWLRHLAKPEESVKALQAGGMPGVAAAYETDTFSNYFEEHPELQVSPQTQKNTVPFPNSTKNPEMFKAVRQNAQLAYEGEKSPEQAMKDAAETMRNALDTDNQ